MPPAARSSRSPKGSKGSRPAGRKSAAKKPAPARRASRKKDAKGAARTPTPAQKAAEAAAQLPEVTDEEALEFLRAIDAYKRRSGRPFPTWSEVLAIVKSLGYRRPAD